MKNIIMILASIGVLYGQLPWPHPPQNQVHPLGNTWGNFQDYGGSPYLHNGCDILTTPLCPVTAIKTGYVKAIWQSGQLYTGISIADSAGSALCFGYMYYHVDPTTIQVAVGDTVYPGDTIAQVVTWPVYSFHHNHFSKNRNSGTTWSSYGVFIRSPLTEFTPDSDSTAPVFTDAVSGQKFAICVNNTSTYLGSDSIYGDVDFICRFEDRINHPSWWCIVYKIVYSIYDTSGTYVVTPTIGFQFSDSIDSYNPGQERVVFKDDATCNTNCDYINSSRRYYYIFTNTNGDSMIMAPDSLQCWQTTTVPNGPYWVKVVASDEYGNSVAESMLVYVRNPVGIEEQETAEGRTMSPGQLVVSPNPSRSRVSFLTQVAVNGPGEIHIYDVSGKMVRTLTFKTLEDRTARVPWDRLDDVGRAVPAGVYYARLDATGDQKPVKFILLH